MGANESNNPISGKLFQFDLAAQSPENHCGSTCGVDNFTLDLARLNHLSHYNLTHNPVSHSTQQRLVQQHQFPEVRVNQEIEELTVDGGKVRLRTPKGLGCEWRDYKAVNVDGKAVAAYFQDNKALLHWVNQQQLSEIVTCIGDGHDGIWNLIAGIATIESRLEI